MFVFIDKGFIKGFNCIFKQYVPHNFPFYFINFISQLTKLICLSKFLLTLEAYFRWYFYFSILLSKVIPHIFHDKLPSTHFHLLLFYFIIYFLRCKLNKNWFFSLWVPSLLLAVYIYFYSFTFLILCLFICFWQIKAYMKMCIYIISKYIKLSGNILWI